MSNSAYIRNITSLEDLRIAIARFCEESEGQLQSIDSKLEARINELKSLDSAFKRMLELAHDDLMIANNSLALCEADTYEDANGNIVYPNCSYERGIVMECQKSFNLAEHNYSVFRKEIRILEIAIAEYQSQKIKYKKLIQFEKEVGISSLKDLINGAEDYLSVSMAISSELSGSFESPSESGIESSTIMCVETVEVCRAIFMKEFSFFGCEGNSFNVFNIETNGLFVTIYFDNGNEYICSEVEIENKNSINRGKIVSINIPLKLQKEKIGKYFVQNIEAICRANDCIEIYGWTNGVNIPFYRGLGYEVRYELSTLGGEVFKSLSGNFSSLQQSARNEFLRLENSNELKVMDVGIDHINPLNVIWPEEAIEEKFWAQHGLKRADYIHLVEKYKIYEDYLRQGKSLDEVREQDFEAANAHDVFYSSEPIQLLKSGNYYRIGGNGRHRIAAAQLYYLLTGRIVGLPADICEVDCK